MTIREFELMEFLLKTLVGTAFAVCFVLVFGVVDWSEPDCLPTVVSPTYINKVVAAELEMVTVDMLEETKDGLEAELWTDSLEYLACCVEAEAGNQSELGKRLVCDTVLNRFDSGKYDTLYDVINEEHNGVYQYSVVGDGRIFKVTPTEETYRIVNEELMNRTSTEVLYFRTKHYHTFGTPMFKEDDHYFSKN